MNLLIIGAGLSGAVLANKFAKAGKKVLVIEKRDVVAGNAFDQKVNGITVHKYGPHIFHTNNEEVYKYMNNFWELNGFKNRVEGKVKDEIVPIPFNFTGIEKFWPDQATEIKEKLIAKFGMDSRITIFQMLEEKDEQLKMVADFIYENIVENYTSKMWGKKPTEIDASVIKRVPVTIGYGSRYFSDKYEGLPKDGYTAAVKKMLDHKNIEVRTGVNAVDLLEMTNSKIYIDDKEVTCPIIYTGALDELFGYKYGALSYRSLVFEFEQINEKRIQNTAVVNYPAHQTMTRITEYKNMTLEESEGTIISREYPGAFDKDSTNYNVPYYPMATDESREQYEKYSQELKRYKNIYPLGRLAEFKYLNMDQIIANALDLAKKLL